MKLIPLDNITNLSDKAQKALKEIDDLIEAYQYKTNPPKIIEVYSSEYDAIEKSIKSKMKLSLSNSEYKGFKITRKQKPKRHNKKKLLEAFDF